VMFDASTDEYGDPTQELPVDTAVTTTATGVDLSLTPDQAFLQDPATQYPVTIDPTTSTISPSFDTYVQQNATVDESSSQTLHIGEFSTYESRAYLRWSLGAYQGLTIQAATLKMWDAGAPACTGQPWQLYSSANANTSTRWTAQPTIGAQDSSATSAAGATGCAAAYINIDAKTWLTTLLSAGTTDGTLMLRAGTETNTAQQKVFWSSETNEPPQLSVTYDRPPGTAGVPTVSPAGSYNSRAYTSSSRPTFATQATDPDGDPVSYAVSVYNSSSGGSLIASCTTGTVASGASASCTPSASLSDNTTYWAEARATDSSGLVGAWSTQSSGAFDVSTTAPPVPTISCPGYTAGSSTVAPGGTISCTITATGSGFDEPDAVNVTVDGGTSSSDAVTTSSTSTVTATVAGTTGTHTLTAYSQSPSNLTSTTASYSFTLTAPSSIQTSTAGVWYSYVESKDAADTLSYSETAPSAVTVCTNCVGGKRRTSARSPPAGGSRFP
jgi:hypothetical protein